MERIVTDTLHALFYEHLPNEAAFFVNTDRITGNYLPFSATALFSLPSGEVRFPGFPDLIHPFPQPGSA